MAELSTFQRLLHALRDEVKATPYYPRRRDELERQKVMTNPVCRSGIAIAPIDKTWWNIQQPWSMTSIRRGRIWRHTMHNIWIGDEGDGRQEGIYDWHCCLTEADWERVKRAYDAAKAACTVVEQRVKELGKYMTAQADQRYKSLKRQGDVGETPMFGAKPKGQRRKPSKRAGATA